MKNYWKAEDKMKEQKTTTQLYQPLGEWNNYSVQNLDFIVTEDCNLRCKYCYICHKASGHVMNYEVAKKFIDYVMTETFTKEPAVILSFIGGEPFLEIKLIDQIVDYFKMKAFETDNQWYWNYRISVTTNGVNYASPEVQRFIMKNKQKSSISITIDGTKEKHDLQRVFPDNSGSYDIIAKNIPLYLKQFYGTTKVTFAHADLPLLKDSILHLWNMGIIDINANVVFENVWEDGDDEIFEQQLKELANEMISKELYKTCCVSLFNEIIGRPLEAEELSMAPCGTGRMLSLGPNGKIYPCMRYKDYSLESGKPEICIGDIESGIDFDKVLRFRLASYSLQMDEECLSCEIANGCQYCQGQNYDTADSETNFQRSKYICRMYKARIRANNYFYNRLYNEKSIKKSDYKNEYKKMYFTLASDFISFCDKKNTAPFTDNMDLDIIQAGLKFSAYNFYSPVFLHSESQPDFTLFNKYSEFRIKHIISAKYTKNVSGFKNYILVFDAETINIPCEYQDYIILNVISKDIVNLFGYVKKLFKITDRINLNIHGELPSQLLQIYSSELLKINNYIVSSWKKNVRPLKEFNRITDIFFSNKQTSCKSGDKDFTIGINGDFYICPHFFTSSKHSAGNIMENNLSVPNARLYSLPFAPLCKNCPATHCVRCSYQNNFSTGEVNIPSHKKCQISMLEYNSSIHFREAIIASESLIHLRELPVYQYNTPYEAYEVKQNYHLGFQID